MQILFLLCLKFTHTNKGISLKNTDGTISMALLNFLICNIKKKEYINFSIPSFYLNYLSKFTFAPKFLYYLYF